MKHKGRPWQPEQGSVWLIVSNTEYGELNKCRVVSHEIAIQTAAKQKCLRLRSTVLGFPVRYLSSDGYGMEFLSVTPTRGNVEIFCG